MSTPVYRRCVIYFAGFDPHGSSHYHRKYKAQAAKQSEVSGYSLEVGDRQKLSPHLSSWSVKFDTSPSSALETANTVHTDYVFAQWDDIVRAHWARMGTLGEKWQWLKTFLATQWFYIQDGAVLRMLRLAWPPVVALVVPLLLFIAVLAAGLATPVVSWWALSAWGVTHAATFWQKLAITGFACLIMGGLLLWLARSLERKFHMLWLMRSYCFTYQLVRGLVPGLDARLQEFGSAIRRAVDGGQYDEVLVVGHSSGAMMAASALAYALKLPPSTKAAPQQTTVGLVTLGQCIPMLSSVSTASEFRAQLAQLAQCNSITWVDFCAPTDGCCFAFVDATAPSGIASAARSSQPKLLSPRFQTLFSAHDYQQLCRHRFDLHFQYIHAGNLLGNYDYFAITAGPQNLITRYACTPSVVDFKKFRLFG